MDDEKIKALNEWKEVIEKDILRIRDEMQVFIDKKRYYEEKLAKKIAPHLKRIAKKQTLIDQAQRKIYDIDQKINEILEKDQESS
jgi:hypothetical protein